MFPAACRSALLAILLTLPAAASAQLVNGSFEPASPFSGNQILPGGSTAIPGWITTDTGVEWFSPLPYGIGPAPDGATIVDLANYVYSAGGIAQAIPTTPGELVQIRFMFGTSASAGRDGTAEIVVSADGQSQVHTITNPAAIVAWESRTFSFTADDASATVSFRCLQNAYVHFAFVDGVSRDQTTDATSRSWAAIKRLYTR